MWQSSSI